MNSPTSATAQINIDASATTGPRTVVVQTGNEQVSLSGGFTVAIAIQPPVANPGGPYSGNVGQTITFDGSKSTAATGQALTYAWDFGDTTTGSNVKPAHAYSSGGTFTVSLTVTDPSGGTNAATTVAVVNQNPQISSTPVSTGQAGVAYSHQVLANDPDGDPLSYALTTAPQDMTISATGLITWTTPSAGAFQVTVSVTDGRGGSATQPYGLAVTPANVTVPNVAGLTQAAATDTLVGEKLTVGTVTQQTSATVPAGSIISQTPAAGTSVAQGSPVNLVVSQVTGLPPDPATGAPPLDRSVATTVFVATEFLYTGTNPIQTGVASGTIEPTRAAVVRGRMLTREGTPLPGVTTTILNHPEFGQTLSRADGMFDMAVNGGGLLTVTYQKAGFLPAQRQVTAPWQAYAFLPDVILIPFDTQVTLIDLSSTLPMQVARGTPVSDNVGPRQATLLFPQGTQAAMVMPDGSTQPLGTLHVRATEYTVGLNGPAAMPATLPPTSAYTYAVEFSADEAVAAGAKQLVFTQPVISYTENFRGFPVGGIVPAGYYDRDKAAWIPFPNGRVIKVLTITDGLAELDIDGSGVPATASALAALGVTDVERQHLAVLYQAGQRLWRVLISHLTPCDFNWGFGLPLDAVRPSQPAPPSGLPDDPCTQGGSIIECQTQILGEAVPITGTPFTLHYQSDRAPGRRDLFMLDIPLSGPELPESIRAIEYVVEVAGRRIPNDPLTVIVGDQNSLANLSRSVTWDGKDAEGRLLQGQQSASIHIGYVYPCVYTTAKSFGSVGGPFSVSVLADNCTITLWQVHQRALGTWTALPEGLGGWSLDVHHAYDPVGKVLYFGDGGRRSATALESVITTVAGSRFTGFSGDGGPATQAKLSSQGGMALAPDGSLYIADSFNNRVRKVDPHGIITTVAGAGGAPPFGGDGGPATAAKLLDPYDVAFGPDGSLYIADRGNQRIRRVAPNGIITTVAGNGLAGFAGDDGPATAATLSHPHGIDVGPDGSLYIADYLSSHIRRVGPDGIITTVAGNGTLGLVEGDGGPATQARLKFPEDVVIAVDGSLYIADSGYNRIRRVGPDGIITTVAGSAGGYSGDGGPAHLAKLSGPIGVALGPDGSLYIADTGNGRVRRVDSTGLITTLTGTGFHSASCPSEEYCGDGGPATAAHLPAPRRVAVGPDENVYVGAANTGRVHRVAPVLPGLTFTDLAMPAEDGSELYIFDALGRHLRTQDILTGAVRYEFGYESAGRLTKVIDKRADGPGNITTIQHDASGNPMAIMGPFGQQTDLTVWPTSYLKTIRNPAGEMFSFDYWLYGGEALGLLASLTNPRGQTSHFLYDEGRLITDSDPAGGFKALNRTNQDEGWTVALSTALGTTTHYQIEKLSTGGQQRTNTLPSGLQTVTQIGANGTRTTTLPDGVTTTLVEGPDPRFKMLTPLPQSLSISTPGGKHFSRTVSRTVTLADPNDPLSLTSQTDTVAVNGKTFTSTFDAAAKTITSKTPLQRQTVATLDSKGRVVGVAITGLEPIAFTYDTKGRPKTMTQGTRASGFSYNPQGYLASVTDPLNRTTAFAYDVAGRVTTQTLPDGRQVGYTYDANGNISSLIPPGRPSHDFTFTPVDLLKDYMPPDVGLANESTVYTYDLDKRLDLITRPDGATIDLAYDSAGRVSTNTAPDRTVSYTYASASDPSPGNLTQIDATDGTTLTYAYDGSLLTDVTWSGPILGTIHWGYDNNFRVVSETVNNEPALSFVYDNDGLLTHAGALTLSRNAQNGLLAGTSLGSLADTFTYNAFAEVTDYGAAYAGSSKFSMHVDRDALGRIGQKTESIDSGAPQTYTYQYDTAGRLSGVSQDGTNVAHYTYDQNGNRLSYAGPGGTLTGSYDDQDRLTSYGNATYTYTANGELQSKTISGQLTTYHYDVFGNLRAVTLPSGTQLEYVVDGANRRIGKKVNGTPIQGFLYRNGLKPVAELGGGGSGVAQFVYASRGHVPDYMIKNGVTYRILSDHLGSPRLVVEVATGMVAQRVDYDEFGRVIQDTNPGFQPFGFAGGLYDPSTGLVQFGARDYDPEVGRWTAKDPIRFAGGDTNLYGYVMGDPVNVVDPTGNGPPQGLEFGVQIGGALLEIGGQLGGGIFIDFEHDSVSFFGTYGYGTALGLGLGASGMAGWVNNSDAFWGEAFEYGTNTPVGGLSFSSAPDSGDSECSSGIEGLYGESGSLGPSLGGDVHFFKTNTIEIIELGPKGGFHFTPPSSPTSFPRGPLF